MKTKRDGFKKLVSTEKNHWIKIFIIWLNLLVPKFIFRKVMLCVSININIIHIKYFSDMFLIYSSAWTMQIFNIQVATGFYNHLFNLDLKILTVFLCFSRYHFKRAVKKRNNFAFDWVVVPATRQQRSVFWRPSHWMKKTRVNFDPMGLVLFSVFFFNLTETLNILNQTCTNVVTLFWSEMCLQLSPFCITAHFSHAAWVEFIQKVLTGKNTNLFGWQCLR